MVSVVVTMVVVVRLRQRGYEVLMWCWGDAEVLGVVLSCYGGDKLCDDAEKMLWRNWACIGMHLLLSCKGIISFHLSLFMCYYVVLYVHLFISMFVYLSVIKVHCIYLMYNIFTTGCSRYSRPVLSVLFKLITQAIEHVLLSEPHHSGHYVSNQICVTEWTKSLWPTFSHLSEAWEGKVFALYTMNEPNIRQYGFCSHSARS